MNAMVICENSHSRYCENQYQTVGLMSNDSGQYTLALVQT